jgi:hypothetical protein
MAFPHELLFELDRWLSGCNPALAIRLETQGTIFHFTPFSRLRSTNRADAMPAGKPYTFSVTIGETCAQQMIPFHDLAEQLHLDVVELIDQRRSRNLFGQCGHPHTHGQPVFSLIEHLHHVAILLLINLSSWLSASFSIIFLAEIIFLPAED